MTLLDVMGKFWLAANPDLQVAGRLIIDAMHKAQLELIDPLSLGDDDDQRYRILGNAAGNLLTLDRCIKIETTEQISHHGPSVREKYSPAFVLEGAHFKESNPVEFDSVTIRLQNLEHWVGITGMKADFSTDEVGIKEINMKYTPIQKHSADIDCGSVDLSFKYNFSVSVPKVDESCSLTIKFSSKNPIMEIFRICSDLQDLLTLGVGKSSAVIETKLGHDGFPGAINLYYRWRGSSDPAEDQTIDPRRMFTTFPDIGGIEGIARWIDTAKKFHASIAPIRSYWYIPNLNIENKFISLVIAAEALDRIRSEDGPIFPERIRNLANSAGSIFISLVGDIDQWVNEIRTMRTEFIHHTSIHSDEGSNVNYVRMHFLSESLYFLIVICLLKECGVLESDLINVRNSQFWWTAAQLRQQSS